MTSACHWKVLLTSLFLVVSLWPGQTLVVANAQTVTSIVNISPTRAEAENGSLDIDPDSASGGRINHLAVDPNNNRILYAASAWGGLWKATDGGKTWSHLDGFLPQATWDVAVDPANPQHLYATALFDGKVRSLAGISLSNDGGRTWVKPPSTIPPGNFCDLYETRAQPHAFGIAIDSQRPAHVVVGTNCGVAISNDSGATWRYARPWTGQVSGYNEVVWSAVVHHGGIIDICSDRGHFRSQDDGRTWRSADRGAQPLAGGTCSIVVSPDEPDVLFAVTGTTLSDSVDGGRRWRNRLKHPEGKGSGRIPFLATNPRGPKAYDLWFGDVSLWRRRCLTPASTTETAPRCGADPQAWDGLTTPDGGFKGFTREAGGHDDTGDIVFATTGPTTCPLAFASDGGVFLNTKVTEPGCHSPRWTQPDRTPQTLWSFDLLASRDRVTGKLALYLGTQDNGTFATFDGLADTPRWTIDGCCDGSGLASDGQRVLSTICCGDRGNMLQDSKPGLRETKYVELGEPREVLPFSQLDSVTSFGPGSFALATVAGVFVTTAYKGDTTSWRALGRPARDGLIKPCGIQISRNGPVPVFYALGVDPSHINPDADPRITVIDNSCSGEGVRFLFRYQGTAGTGRWQRLARPEGSWNSIYATDPFDHDHVVAADIGNEELDIVQTTDGGRTWTSLSSLISRMNGGGAFVEYPIAGPSRTLQYRRWDDGYSQPTLLAISPENPYVMVGGAADSGLFLSIDGGTTWKMLTDPVRPATSGIPHIPRPFQAIFDHGEGGKLALIIGSMGRGVWRIKLDGVPKAKQSSLHADELFKANTAVLKTDALPRLTELARQITVAPHPLAYLDVYTSSARTSQANLTLANLRARTLAAWLRGQGRVPTAALRVRGFTEFGVTNTSDRVDLRLAMYP